MRELGTLAVPVVSALPTGGTTGQLVSYGGSIWQYSGVGWIDLGAAAPPAFATLMKWGTD